MRPRTLKSAVAVAQVDAGEGGDIGDAVAIEIGDGRRHSLINVLIELCGGAEGPVAIAKQDGEAGQCIGTLAAEKDIDHRQVGDAVEMKSPIAMRALSSCVSGVSTA